MAFFTTTIIRKDKMRTHAHDEPYRLFNTISLEIAAKCNRRCVFCPNAYFERPDEYMPMDLIEKVVDELADMNYNGRFEPYIYNEPTRDERLLDIIAMVRERVPRSCIMINTNGDYFKDEDDIIKLFQAGLNQLAINVYSAADGCGKPRLEEKGIVRARKRQEELQAMLDCIEDVEQEGTLYRKIPPSKMIARVIPKFGVQVDGDGFGGGFELQNRSGLIDFMPKLKEPLEKMCIRPFRIMQVNWNGEVLLCCNDFNAEVKFGNIRDHSLVDLWSCEKMNLYRLHLQNEDRNTPLCDRCDYKGGPYPHMISHVEFPDDDAAISVPLTYEGMVI